MAMHRNFVGFATVLAIAFATPVLAQPVVPDADPALWVVRDADTTIYLFGTVHALPSGITWFDDRVREAFDESDELVMELVDPTPEDGWDLLRVYGTANDGRRMTQRLNPDQRVIYQRTLRRVGMPIEALENAEPWVIAQLLSCECARGNAGRSYRRTLGVETRLTQAAEHRNMAISALENHDMQIGIFAHLSMPAQVAYLMETLNGPTGEEVEMDDLLAAWTRGDVDQLGTMIDQSMADTPELRENMLTTRNERWAGWIQLRLDEAGGKFFVAVGAAHLAGHDSVQSYLATMGIVAERVRY